MGLKEYFKYDPETGTIFWVKPRKNIKVGDVAGCTTKTGYRIISFGKKCYKAHRLAWYLHYGIWPTKALDHINRCPTDNRISNLREVTPQQNMANSVKHKDNSSGYKGVYWRAQRKRWAAQIQMGGTTIYLGQFKDIKLAAKAYMDIAEEWYGTFNQKEA